MRIRFVKTCVVDVEKIRLQEIWDKAFNRWDEVNAESLQYSNNKVDIVTKDGDVLIGVPIESFEVVK
jgi:hypothetical protein